ncbi:MAG: hypothetical protein V4451_04840 [Pseudomonadota bacterium]
MTPHTHNCAAVGCQKQIPLNMLMCGNHWNMVPTPISREVLSTWRSRNKRPSDQEAVRAHEDAKSKAVAAVEAKQNRKIAAKVAAEGGLF